MHGARHGSATNEIHESLEGEAGHVPLSFLLLIGVTLIADGFGLHIDKAYIYAAMAFSVFVEFLNLRARHRDRPIELRPTYVKEKADAAS